VFAIGLALFSLTSLLCALAPTALFLILARAGQGIGGAIMFSTSLALLAQDFQGRERGTAFGVWGATIGASTAVGPLVGGALTQGFGWSSIFYINVPIGIAAAVLTLAKVPESRDPAGRRLDWIGTVTFTGALFLLVFAVIRGNDWTALLAGFIVAGAGIGLVNPPLASTAIGVVPPERSGMASGINSTFRQVGIATGIAVLGAIFESALRSKLATALAHTPLAGSVHSVAHAVAAGGGPTLLTKVPSAGRAQVANVIHSAFAAALNDILLVGAVVAIAGAALGLVLVRSSDFATYGAHEPAAAAA
jgi:MFS family permease